AGSAKAKGLDGTVVPAQAADEPPFHILGYLISNKNQGYPLEPTRRISPGPIGEIERVAPRASARHAMAVNRRRKLMTIIVGETERAALKAAMARAHTHPVPWDVASSIDRTRCASRTGRPHIDARPLNSSICPSAMLSPSASKS